MHFHFIGSRETLFTLSCTFRHTLVPVSHKWLCLVGVILSIPGGRAEFTRWSCTDHGCKLNTPMGWGRPTGTCLPVIFRHWVHLWPACCSYSCIRRVALLLPLAATLYPMVSPVEMQPMPLWHMLSTGLGLVLFSLHSTVAASTRQYGTCSCVGKGMYWECRWENVKSRKYLASCLTECHSQLETTWLAFTHRYWKWEFLLPAKRSKNTIFHSRNKKAWLAWARAWAVDVPVYPPISLLSSMADPSAFASLQCWILLA